MRLKSMDGPLSMYNGNHNVLNSPKRINTVQNSNITTNNYSNHTEGLIDNETRTSLSDNGVGATNEEVQQQHHLNNINNADVQWCNAQSHRELTNNTNNLANHRRFNINSTLAVSLRASARSAKTASICSPETSPDDSFLEYEEARSSSVDTSPQDEERPFDDVASETDSDDGNLNLNFGRGGIVNPNYPGFQHLAHTLDYGIKCVSDSEEEYADTEHANNNINNNNNDEDTALQNDKIESVNRLDSVENIQKVFYDKPVFNITCEPEQRNDLNESLSCSNIVGNFGEEVEREFSRIANEPELERAVERELEEACEKLAVIDLQPTATKYNIEPNIAEPFTFEKAAISDKPQLQEAVVVKAAAVEMAQVANFNCARVEEMKLKLSDAFLSNVRDNIPAREPEIFMKMELDDSNNLDSNRELVEGGKLAANAKESSAKQDEIEKFCKEQHTKDEKEKDEDSAVPRKKEKVEPVASTAAAAAAAYVKKRRDYSQQIGSLITIPRREMGSRARDNLNRRSLPVSARDKKKSSPEILGGFDVYNIETAMPKIDLEVIESHLRAAREEERRRRTDREEIRRRLAMGNEEDYYNGCDRPGRKPSLQARLQSGMNLQICFMNETASDTESPSSDSECTLGKPKQMKTQKTEEKSLPVRPATLSIGQQPQPQSLPATMNETDFFAKQARLQTEARMALAQAKEMARMQMEIERQRQKKSPITEMVRHSMEKVGIPFPEDRRRLSRQLLTEMNVAQLQVIVNDLHTQIEILNESLVKFLMARDDLHMEQDSMLVDIEDLTRFLGAKEQIIKEHNLVVPSNNNASPPSPAPASPLAAINSSVKPHFNRIASLVKK